MNQSPSSISLVDQYPVGVIGLGLLGRGIATCLLGHGFRVIACDSNAQQRRNAREHIDRSLGQLMKRTDDDSLQIDDWENRCTEVDHPGGLASCGFVIESIAEDPQAKAGVFDQLEAVLDETAIIASNTSAIPISMLQQGREHPERFVGMHWGEPAHILRFVEIIRGEQTNEQTFQMTAELARALGKEPSLVQRDIRGFVTNRLMYAMMREAFYLLEEGVADAETIDRSFRNDMGWWATIAGPFRWMDLTGIPTYAAVMEKLLPQLCNNTEVPKTLRDMVASGAKGIENHRGFYDYDQASARQWQQTWTEFTWDIKALADKHVPMNSSNPEYKKEEPT